MTAVMKISLCLIASLPVLLGQGYSNMFCQETGGMKEFNPTSQICCNGVFDKFNWSKQLECCSHSSGRKELYVKGEKICCGEQLFDVSDQSRHFACCNKKLYDSRTHDCCGNENFGVTFSYTSHDKCCLESKQGIFKLHRFENESDLFSHKCCGTDVYNKNTEQCIFHEGITSVESISERCGQNKTEYDGVRQVCCEDTGLVISKPAYKSNDLLELPNFACHNNTLYDRNIYHVLENRLLRHGYSLCGTEEYNMYEPSLYCCDGLLHKVREGVSVKCCGKELLSMNDNRTQCCNNSIIPATAGCCGDVPFNRGSNRDCCARTLYDTDQNICCCVQSSNAKLVPKEAMNHTNCCAGRTFNVYDYKTCQGGKIIDVPRNDNYILVQQDSEHCSQKGWYKPKQTCPFCTINNTNCAKKYVISVSVYRIKRLERGAHLFGVITNLPGTKYNGMFIRIMTRYYCTCFKRRKQFVLFTNRKMKIIKQKDNWKPRSVGIRMADRDVFVEDTDNPQLKECFNRREDKKLEKKRT